MTRSTTDFIAKFRQGSMVVRFIYLNVGVFVLTTLITLFCTLFKQEDVLVGWFKCPADVWTLLHQPWSLLTYMFLHANVLHILFNMLWFYWFGQLFLQLFSAKHLRGLYVLGGLCGGVLYIVAFNIFPYFQPYVSMSYLVGASASVLAIAIATAVREPNYRIGLMLFGSVRLKYLALVLIVTDLLLITSDNSGGHIAHLGGALAGWWFAKALQKGYDPTAWINAIIDCVGRLFERKPRRKPKMKVYYGERTADYDYNTRRKQQEANIDRILEKIKKSGYGSLSDEEKKTLFDASKK